MFFSGRRTFYGRFYHLLEGHSILGFAIVNITSLTFHHMENSAAGVFLTLKYTFDASDLSYIEDERDPLLLWWTSTSQQWSTESSITFNDYDNQQIYGRGSVKVFVKNVSALRRDDSIYAQCIVYSPNQNDRYVRSKAGTCRICLYDLVETVKEKMRRSGKKEKEAFRAKYDMTMKTCVNPKTNEELKKGELEVILEWESATEARIASTWAFQAATPVDLIPSNIPYLTGVISLYVKKTMLPFDEAAEKFNLRFNAAKEDLSRIHAPLFISEIFPLPGVFYWVDNSKHEPDEHFFNNIADIALQRNKMTAQQFIKSVHTQLKDDTSHFISEDFFNCICIVLDMCCIVSVSLPYIGDYAYLSKRGGEDENKKKRGTSRILEEDINTMKGVFKPHKSVRQSIESFHDALRLLAGDCVAEYEEIYVKGGRKRIKDIEVGDEVLSYDFNDQKYKYKKVLNKWDKGELPLYQVKFNNGASIDVTEKHPIWARTNPLTAKQARYEKIPLNEIDMNRDYTRKTPVAISIPYEIKDIEWLTEDHCFLVGHFLAEGFNDGHHVRTSGHEIPEEVIPRLEIYNIPYSKYKNNSGVPIVSYLASPFKEYLRKMLRNSFDFELPEEMLHLPQNKLEAILDGYFCGDGHYHKRGKNENNIEKIYSTSCHKFAIQLHEISLKLGRYVYIYKQEKHGGVGKKPIYRIHDYKNTECRRPQGYEGLGEARINSFEENGTAHMYDIEVEDTHTFVFRNGILGHNCEDLAKLIHRIASMLDRGIAKYADKTQFHKRHGGWNTPLLDAMQRIAHLYVSIGVLGSVTSRYLGEDKTNKRLPIINSEEDNNAEIGAHMFQEYIPLYKIENYISNAGNYNTEITDETGTTKKVFRLFPNEKRYKWVTSLPHLVGEGTGYLDCLLKAISEYFSHDKSLQSRRIENCAYYIEGIRTVLTSSQLLRKFYFKRPQYMLRDIKESRLSTFYREAVHSYTDKFLLEGYNFSEFTWTYMGTCQPIKQTDGENNAWRYGITMRERLFDNGEEGSPIGLVISPPYTEPEFAVIKSIMRHLPPLKNPVYDLPEDYEEITADVHSFNESMREGLNGELNDSYRINYLERNKKQSICFYSSSDIFKNTAFREALKNEILNLKNTVIKAVAFVEVITKDISNIRIEVTALVPLIDQRIFVNSKINPVRLSTLESIEKNSVCYDNISIFHQIKPTLDDNKFISNSFSRMSIASSLINNNNNNQRKIPMKPIKVQIRWNSAAQEDESSSTYLFNTPEEAKYFSLGIKQDQVASQVFKNAAHIIDSKPNSFKANFERIKSAFENGVKLVNECSDSYPFIEAIGNGDEDDNEDSDIENFQNETEGDRNYNFESDSNFDASDVEGSIKKIARRRFPHKNFIIVEWTGDNQDDNVYKIYTFNKAMKMKIFKKVLKTNHPEDESAEKFYKGKIGKSAFRMAIDVIRENQGMFPRVVYVHEQ